MVESLIDECNAVLEPFDFEIRSTRDQIDRHTIYALVGPLLQNVFSFPANPARRQINTASDTLIQTATPHSADEIAFFRRLLDAMFETNNTLNAEVLAVKANDAIHLNKKDDGTAALTLKAAEDALGAFVDEGWLAKSRYPPIPPVGYQPTTDTDSNNWYSLAPRGLLELAGYLKTTYNDGGSDSDDETAGSGDRVKSCEACREIITVGLRCGDLRCRARFHRPCEDQYFKVHRERRCPLCKAAWDAEPVGEEAAAKLRRRIVRSGGGTPGGQRVESVGGVEVEESAGEGMDVEVEVEVSTGAEDEDEED